MLSNIAFAYSAAEIHQLISLAEKGNVKAQTAMGIMYTQGLAGVDKNYDKGFYWAKKAAKGGSVEGALLLGTYYLGNYSSIRDIPKAIHWLTIAAQKGSVLAQNNLGFIYSTGSGTEADYQKAFKWIMKAAKQGSAMAQANVGVFYLNGKGVTEDDVKAYAWIKASGTARYLSQSAQILEGFPSTFSDDELTQANRLVAEIKRKYPVNNNIK